MKRNVLFLALCLALLGAATPVQARSAGASSGIEPIGSRSPQARSQSHYGYGGGRGDYRGGHGGYGQRDGWGGPAYYAVGPPPAPFSQRSQRRYRRPSYGNGYHHCPDYGWHAGRHGWR